MSINLLTIVLEWDEKKEIYSKEKTINSNLEKEIKDIITEKKYYIEK